MLTLGVDVSAYQPAINWPALFTAGYRFAYVRCCEGLKLDLLHNKHVADARAAGFAAGSYQFGHPSQDAGALADFFRQHCDVTELRPVIDMESLNADNTVPTSAAEWADAWCEILKTDTQSEPLIYASTSYWRTMCGLKPDIGGPLGWGWWMAQYAGSSTANHPIVGMPYIAHQFAGNVPVKGQLGLWDLDAVYADSCDVLRV